MVLPAFITAGNLGPAHAPLLSPVWVTEQLSRDAVGSLVLCLTVGHITVLCS